MRFVKALLCRVPGCNHRPSENAHARNGGMGRKADYTDILPLCRQHHRELDEGRGRAAFEEKYELSLEACADWTEWKWQQAGDFPELDF